ncbi:electron transport complex subunit RsxC [Alkalimarinus sediminis]|uniref:Ion-translocating oxidoreductase complex subunit C n=1 Tax=Alkalimarinus sediminis TaxID=1632866 RepID=A0A9E8HLP7_9ALTE|nr:electron transport complex subunit RsxC [Alkalimarinus sediminis]UZW75642.1 electron transport complex subunit RsxC [Alkalimarinus sediminis]
MKQIWDFHGGIHPQENKEQSNQSNITDAGIPPLLILPLQQHIGQRAEPVVNVGDKVLKGQLVAKAAGPVSVSVHAPTSGTVTSISDHPVPHASGMSDLCVLIETDGEDKWCERNLCEDYSTLSKEELLNRIRNAGIAGMGGAGFPTAIKLHPPRQDKVNTLILNGAECEPYITSDDRLMRERAEEIILGLEIMAYILQPGECLIGVEDNKPEAIKALREAAKETQIEVVTIPTKYPSGGEKQLIKILTGHEVPNGRIPADIGVMCQNVATAAAVYRAIRFGEPLISRITTMTGDCIANKGNVEVLIGTPIDWLLEQHGYLNQKGSRLVMGGPMMGFTLHDTHLPVVKTTNCLLAATNKELAPPQPAQACIRCGMCSEVCPAELLPQQLYWFAKGQEFEKAEHHNLFDCIECGACSYVCPSTIPLVQYYRYAKGELKQIKADQEKSNQARERFEFRQERIEREKAEKEAKRKARAEAAAKAQAAKKEAEAEAKASSESPAKSDKAAAIEAALKRVDAKKQAQASTVTPEVTLESLQKKLLSAEDKFSKMESAWKDALENNPERAEKLATAVESSKNNVEKLKAQIDEMGGKSEVQAPAGPSIDELKSNVEKAKNKLQLMLDTLEDAKQNHPDRVEKLERAITKNRTRVSAAEAALSEAMNSETATESTESNG